MVHAWIWKDSPAGVFSPFNPAYGSGVGAVAVPCHRIARRRSRAPSEDAMFSPARLMLLLTGLTMFLFQTHWVDDLGTDDRDVLGITVSAVGSVLLFSGLLLLRRGCRRALLALGFLFVAFVSAADLRGLDAEGALAPDVIAHWRDNLGYGLTLAVALTLFLEPCGRGVTHDNGTRSPSPGRSSSVKQLSASLTVATASQDRAHRPPAISIQLLGCAPTSRHSWLATIYRLKGRVTRRLGRSAQLGSCTTCLFSSTCLMVSLYMNGTFFSVPHWVLRVLFQ